MRTTTAFALGSTVLFMLACSGKGAGDLSKVLPDDRVLINLPVEDSGSARVGEWSEYYLFTAEVVDDVNFLAGTVLATTGAIVQYPASSTEGDTSFWGPYADTLDPAETQLWVTANEDGTYSWGYDQRPKNDDAAEWTTVVTGEVDAGATEEASSGRFSVDWTAMKELNPNVHATGVFEVDYDLGTDGVSGTARFVDVLWDGADQAVDADYAYEQIHEGGGTMDLAVDADMGAGGAQDEHLMVRSRWDADGVGRSDARLSDGDLGDFTATASECWDPGFQSVYYVDNYTPIEEGDVAGCVFAEAEFAEE